MAPIEVGCTRYGMDDGDLEERLSMLANLVAAYPADVAEAAIEQVVKASDGVPSYAKVYQALEAGMEARKAMVDAMRSAAKNYTPRDVEPETYSTSGLRVAPIRRPRYYARKESGEYVDKGGEFCEAFRPEGKPQEHGYQPPDLGEDVADLRKALIRSVGEPLVHAWFDLVRVADPSAGRLLAPHPWIVKELRERLGRHMPGWSVELAPPHLRSWAPKETADA